MPSKRSAFDHADILEQAPITRQSSPTVAIQIQVPPQMREHVEIYMSQPDAATSQMAVCVDSQTPVARVQVQLPVQLEMPPGYQAHAVASAPLARAPAVSLLPYSTAPSDPEEAPIPFPPFEPDAFPQQSQDLHQNQIQPSSPSNTQVQLRPQPHAPRSSLDYQEMAAAQLQADLDQHIAATQLQVEPAPYIETGNGGRRLSTERDGNLSPVQRSDTPRGRGRSRVDSDHQNDEAIAYGYNYDGFDHGRSLSGSG